MLIRYYRRLEDLLSGFTLNKRWKLFLPVLCCLYCILSNTPAYTSLFKLNNRITMPVWQTINHQADHLLQPSADGNPLKHEAKLAFRLVPPMLAKLSPSSSLSGRMTWLFFLQNIAGLVFIYLLAKLVERHTGDAVMAVLISCSVCVLYTAKTFFCDLTFFFDSFAFLFLLISISSSNFAVVFFAHMLGCFTDERTVLAGGFVMLFHLLQTPGKKKLTGAVVAPLAVIAVYIPLRLVLQSHFGLTTPHGKGSGVSVQEILSHVTWEYFAMGIFTAFKSFWLLLLLGVFVFRSAVHRFIYVGTLLVVVLMGISVYDFSRSISYAFIGILIVLFELRRQGEDGERLRKLVLVLLLTSWINPIFSVRGKIIDFSTPIYEKLTNRFYKSDLPA